MIDYQLLLGQTIDRRETSFRIEDTIQYALAVGFGTDPTDRDQLRFVYEQDLVALPSMSLTLAYPGFWLRRPEYQVDWPRLLHAEEHFEIHRPLPVSGTVLGQTVVEHIVDRGLDKGAFIYSKKEVRAKADGALLATVKSTTLCRGDGGFGGPAGPRPEPVAMPVRAADLICDLPTIPQLALLYRLCGDMNPLHADPAVAKGAGFERPILHGRCTMAIAQHALLKSCCAYDARRLRSMRVRFSAPFLPGETLRTEIWRGDRAAWFSSSSVERGVTVLSNGYAEIQD